MIVRLDTQRLQTLDQVEEFLAGSRPLDLRPETRAETYAFVAEVLERFDYPRRGKTDKGLLRRFLAKVAGLSRAQVTRLLHQHRTTGAITDRRGPRRPFPRRYTKADIGLLAEVDALHGTLSGPVTQFQFVGSVERIETPCLAPVLEALLQAFPFRVHGFHADNGTEFINRKVAALLEALHIDEFTKSRPRRSNDNALVESKNGSVIRKHLGHGHIPSRHAERVNAFTQQVLSPYLNFHRPCLFPVEAVDAKGRVRKRYPHANVMTPYEKLKSLPAATACLKPGISFNELDAVAAEMSDNEAARVLNQARDRLFAFINPAA